MANTISRRSLLRKGALLAGGLPFAASLWDQAKADPLGTRSAISPTAGDTLHPLAADASFLTDRDIALGAPVDLKARLYANENPFGPSDKAKKAIMDALPTSYQYPFLFLKDLTQKIADHEGVKQENILMAAGSSPLLMAAAMYFSKTGSNVVSGYPTYEDLPSKAVRFHDQWVKVPLTTDYGLDLDAMEKSIDGNTGLVYICNPNNPTGTVLDAQKLKSFCEKVSARVPIFIDEAYIDYLDDPAGMTMISGIKAGQNIIVARTFSKIYGFAGLRVGYVVAQPDMIKKLSDYTVGSLSISATSLQGAIACFQDKEYMQGVVNKTVASKNYLYDVLKKEGYSYVPSVANFVIFPIKMEGKQFTDEMMKRGVGVRHWTINNKEYCRISIGRMDEMEAFATAFKEIS
jgi:histidinol-phosphate aminotransferase